MKKDITQIKYIAYSRKSTEGEDRQILSLDDQKREIEEIEHRENLKIVERYLGSDKGESQSAHKRGRPVFGHVMDQIEAGAATGLIVWHPNRLARNAFDGGLIITLMDEGKLLEIRTPGRTYRNTPDDKFFLQLEFGIAKKSSDDSSVAVKRGLKTKILMGIRPGRTAIGYLNTIIRDKGSNDIIKDPERFDTVKRMWQMMLTGNYTVPELLRIVNKDWKFKTRATRQFPGGMPMSKSHLYAVFTNSYYYGWFEYGNPKQLYKSSHEPMITEEEFDRVQKILGRKGKPRPKTHRFAFSGLIRCGGCGSMITAEEKIKRQQNGNVHHYVYYHCTHKKDEKCTEKLIKLEDLEAQIDVVLKNLTISEKFKDWAIKYLHEVRQNEAVSNQGIFESKQKQLARITDQLQSLLLKYSSPENSNEEVMTSQEYQSLKGSLLKQKAALEDDVRAQGKTIEDWLMLSEKTFNFACYARAHFNNGTMETKRAVLSALGSNLVINDRKISIELHPFYKIIFDNVDAVERELIKVRTSESSINKRDILEILAKCPALRGQ